MDAAPVPVRRATLEELPQLVSSLEQPLIVQGINLSTSRGPLTAEVFASSLAELDGSVEHSRDAVFRYYQKSKPLSMVRGFDMAQRGVSSHWNMSASELLQRLRGAAASSAWGN